MTQKKIAFLIAFLIIESVFEVFAINVPLPVVRNFSKKVYEAANQNWSVVQGTNGFIYVANHIGLLEYNGNNWKFYPSPNGAVMRSVAVDDNGNIFTGGYREFGYWSENIYGDLEYTSLSNKIKNQLNTNEEFWDIIINKEKIYFKSFSAIYVYDGKSIRKIIIHGFGNSISKIKNDIYVSISNEGIFRLENDSLIPWLTNSFFTGKTILVMLPWKASGMLIGTESNGAYSVENGSISPWAVKTKDFFSKNKINRGIQISHNNYVFGTILNGIIGLDAGGNELFRLNLENGLQNNTILGMKSDRNHNLWLAQDVGISLVTFRNDPSYFKYTQQELGAVYDAAVFEGNLYLATNQGLYVKPWPGPHQKFSLVTGTQGQVWDLKIIDNQLLIGNNTGTFRIFHNNIRKISGESGGFSIIRKEYGDEALIQCTYSNLVIYRKKNGLWELSNIVQNHSDLLRFIEEDPYGNLWASHFYHGLFRIRLNNSLDSVIFVKNYTAEIPVKDHTINVFKVENRIVFTSGFTLYTYDDINDTITEYKALSEPLGRFAAADQIITAPDHHYWLITDREIGLFSIYGNEVKLIKSFPAELFNNELVNGFENLYPLKNNQAILCLENGYALLDANIHPDKFPIMQQLPVVSQLTSSNLNGNEHKLPPADTDFTLKSNWNNLAVRFAFPYYTSENITYSYKIEGLDNDWSEKHANPDFNFQRLPAGSYTLKVKATDSWGHSSQVSELNFEVQPPWYLSTLARVIYVILLALFLLLYRYNVVRKTKLREKKIQESRERELIRLRNEKLQAEVTHKSKELANSTMAIIKKNEFLLELKNILRKQKGQLGTRYPDKYFATVIDRIDRNIVSKDDWNVFETNFERAHEQFLNKVKKTYPSLTASDLRLCAYLRMNLTSKEIAPLLGISVRGVENHRYRLRKKMEVSNEESLTDFILSL